MLPPGTAAARFPVVCGVAGRNRSTGDGVEQELDLGAINCLIAQCVIAQCVGDQCVGDQLRGRSIQIHADGLGSIRPD